MAVVICSGMLEEAAEQTWAAWPRAHPCVWDGTRWLAKRRQT